MGERLNNSKVFRSQHNSSSLDRTLVFVLFTAFDGLKEPVATELKSVQQIRGSRWFFSLVFFNNRLVGIWAVLALIYCLTLPSILS